MHLTTHLHTAQPHCTARRSHPLVSSLDSPSCCTTPLHGTPPHPKPPGSRSLLAAAGLSPASAPRARLRDERVSNVRVLHLLSSSRRCSATSPPFMRSARDVRGSARGRGPPPRGGRHGSPGTSKKPSTRMTMTSKARAQRSRKEGGVRVQMCRRISRCRSRTSGLRRAPHGSGHRSAPKASRNPSWSMVAAQSPRAIEPGLREAVARPVDEPTMIAL
jgi:hypothetical protein